jgi:hypothetical protein
MSLAAMVSPANHSSRVCTGPQGTSAASSAASHSARGCVRKAASSLLVVICAPGATNAARRSPSIWGSDSSSTSTPVTSSARMYRVSNSAPRNSHSPSAH